MSDALNLPPHGRLTCRKCFTSAAEIEEIEQWQVVNDPSAWGAERPEILVLGFSKGFTQATAFKSGAFEDIPFKSMRSRLTQALQRLGLLATTETVQTKFSATEQRFAFGSLVRCSLSRLNAKSGKRECTGQVMPKAFVEPVRKIVQRCAETFLGRLPASVRLVIMLGSGDSYIDGCRKLIATMTGQAFRPINEVAYHTPGVLWIHIAHPSGMNGYFNPWVAGAETDPSGRKLLQALSALAGIQGPALGTTVQ